MNLHQIKCSRLENRSQAILFTEEGTVLESDDVLFKTNPGVSNIFEDTYFFAGMTDNLMGLGPSEELTFNCVGLSLFGYESYFDFIVGRARKNEEDHFYWLILDYGDQYRRVIDIQQERNIKAIESKKFERRNREIKEEKEAIERLYKELNLSGGSEYILIKADNLLVNVDFSNILYFEAFGDYVKVHTDEKVYVVHTRMKEVEEAVPLGKFYRIHRSFLVQMSKISNIEQLSLAIGDRILPIGKNNKHELLQQMGQL